MIQKFQDTGIKNALGNWKRGDLFLFVFFFVAFVFGRPELVLMFDQIER